MKKEVGEIWSEMIGSRKVWTVQFPNGRMTFNTKKVAMRWVDLLNKEKGGDGNDTT